MNVAILAHPSPLTSRVCSLDRCAFPLTRFSKVLTEVSYFMVSYFGHSYIKCSMCLVLIEENVIVFDCGNGRSWASHIYPHPQKQIIVMYTKIQCDYLLKRYWILYGFVISDVFTMKTLKITVFTFGMSVEPSIFRTRQLEKVWRKCNEIVFWRVLLKFVDTFLFWLIL
jgi:hypothetical protein